MAEPNPSALTMYRPDTGEAVEVDPSQAGALFREGKATFREDQDIPVRGEDGRIQLIKGADAEAYFRSTIGLVGGASSGEALRRQQLQDEFGGVGGTLGAAAAGVARGATLGLSDAALTGVGAVDARTLAGLQEANPLASTAGEVGGMIAPLALSGGSGAVAKGAAVLGAPTRAVMGVGRAVEAGGAALLGEGALARAVTSAAGAAAEGALFGVGQAASQAAVQDVDLTAERIMAAAGHGALFGGALGGGSSLLGSIVRNGATRAAEEGASLLMRHNERAALLGEELASAGVPKTEAAVKVLSSEAGRELAFTSMRASARERATLAAMGGDIEARALRQYSEDISRVLGKGEGVAIRSMEERAVGAQKLAEEASARVRELSEELAQKGVRADVARLAADVRMQAAEAGGGKLSRRAEELARDLEATGGDASKVLGIQRELRKEIESSLAAGETVSDNLVSKLSGAIDGEMTRMGETAAPQLGPEFTARWSNALGESKAAGWVAETTARAARAATDEPLLGSDVMLGFLGTALGNGNVLGAAVGAAGKVLKTLVERHGADVAAQLARAVTSGEAVHALDATMTRIAGEKVAALVQGGRRAVGELPDVAPGVGVAVERAVRQEQPAAEVRGSVPKRFRAARDELTSTLSTRDARLAAATEGLDDIAPGLGKALRARATAASDFLASKLPKMPQPASLQPHLERERLPSLDEMTRYLRYERAVSDPLSAIDDARRGKLRAESVEALKAVYPTLYEALRSQVVGAVAEKRERLTYQQKLQLGMLLDIPTHPSLEPEAIASYQAAQYRAPSPFTPPQGNSPSPRPRTVPLKPPDFSLPSDHLLR